MSSSSNLPANFTDDDLFFPEIHAKAVSPEELQQYCSNLEAFRRAAHRHLLHPGWSFTCSIPPYSSHRGDNPLQPQRPLPDFALRGGDYRFTLIDALQPFEPVSDIHSTSHGQWSQVWVADVHTATKSSPSLGSVVLKIFQSSLFPIPRVTDFDDVMDNHLVARELANTEFFVYERMRSLQGGCVPYFFGRSKTIMPNGEEARILILEFINGLNLGTWCRQFSVSSRALREERLENELSPILHAVHKSARKLMNVPVYHRDVLPRNFIYVESTGSAVLIDFARSRLLDGKEVISPPDEAEEAVKSILLSCFENYPDGLEAWTSREGYLPPNVTW